ncbi:DNA polymerase III subunit gamma/tau, partial [Escherichia coli]|nr:DNA polymerase III subunit gamma/tau [Escherichia coli]
TPCNQCVNCEEITASRSVDVLEIDGASNTGVDDVRQIIENVRYQAAKSRSKVYIIDEVHMLSNSAFNALLKTLEEPPP